MKKIFLSAITILILCSCSGANQQQSTDEFKPSKKSIETLKELLRMICKNNIDAESAFLRKNENEILKTLEVLEEFECESEVFSDKTCDNGNIAEYARQGTMSVTRAYAQTT